MDGPRGPAWGSDAADETHLVRDTERELELVAGGGGSLGVGPGEERGGLSGDGSSSEHDEGRRKEGRKEGRVVGRGEGAGGAKRSGAKVEAGQRDGTDARSSLTHTFPPFSTFESPGWVMDSSGSTCQSCHQVRPLLSMFRAGAWAGPCSAACAPCGLNGPLPCSTALAGGPFARDDPRVALRSSRR